MKKQRVFLSLLLVLALTVGLFSACGGSDKTPEEPEPAAPAAEEPKDPEPVEEKSEAEETSDVTLTFAASQNWIKDIDRKLAEMFTEETGITIDFQLSPDDQYQTIVKSKLNTGEGPDIFMSYSGTKLRDFNPENTMVDLSNEPWVGEMKDWAISGSSYNGTLYALNTAGIDGTNGVLYNTAVFEAYDLEIPTSYEEFTAVCQTLSDNGVIPVYEFVKDLWHTHYWVEGVAAKAVESNPDLMEQLNDNTIGFADVPEFVTAMTQVKEMADLNYFGENHMSNTYDKSYGAIASGEAAMIIIHSSYPYELMDNAEGVDPDQFRMFPNPLADNTGITLTAGGTTRCINASSDHIEEAKQYFEFLARKENAQLLYDERADYMEASVQGVTATPTEANNDITKVSHRILGPEASVYFYDGGKMSELMQEMFVGSLTPEEALEEFDNHRRNIAKDAGLDGF